MAHFEWLFAQTRFRLWSLRMRASLAAVEKPTDIPRVHASGPDPDRILLFGSDIFVGRGVLSHEVAFPGDLARAIARETGRGVDVVIEAHSSLTIEEAVAEARMLELDRYDAVMVDLGSADALGGDSSGQVGGPTGSASPNPDLWAVDLGARIFHRKPRSDNRARIPMRARTRRRRRIFTVQCEVSGGH